MTVKVSKDRLIAAIQAKRDEVVREHEQIKRDAPRLLAEYKKAVIAKAQEFIASVKAAETVGAVTDGLGYNNRLQLPERPSTATAPVTAKYDRALAQLALVVDEFVTLNENKDADFLSLIG